jgi:hypothetical protein
LWAGNILVAELSMRPRVQKFAIPNAEFLDA